MEDGSPCPLAVTLSGTVGQVLRRVPLSVVTYASVRLWCPPNGFWLRAGRSVGESGRLGVVRTGAASAHGRTRRGRTKTTLLDSDAFPAREIAALYAARWQVEIALLQLKRTVRGADRTLRGRSPELVRQEAWALLLAHNVIAALAAAAAGLTPGDITFTAVLSLARAAIIPDTCCPH